MHQREKLGPDPHFESNADPLLLVPVYRTYCSSNPKLSNLLVTSVLDPDP
jgi:hypothetical protein